MKTSPHLSHLKTAFYPFGASWATGHRRTCRLAGLRAGGRSSQSRRSRDVFVATNGRDRGTSSRGERGVGTRPTYSMDSVWLTRIQFEVRGYAMVGLTVRGEDRERLGRG